MLPIFKSSLSDTYLLNIKNKNDIKNFINNTYYIFERSFSSNSKANRCKKNIYKDYIYACIEKINSATLSGRVGNYSGIRAIKVNNLYKDNHILFQVSHTNNDLLYSIFNIPLWEVSLFLMPKMSQYALDNDICKILLNASSLGTVWLTNQKPDTDLTLHAIKKDLAIFTLGSYYKIYVLTPMGVVNIEFPDFLDDDAKYSFLLKKIRVFNENKIGELLDLDNKYICKEELTTEILNLISQKIILQQLT